MSQDNTRPKDTLSKHIIVAYQGVHHFQTKERLSVISKRLTPILAKTVQYTNVAALCHRRDGISSILMLFGAVPESLSPHNMHVCVVSRSKSLVFLWHITV